MTTLSSLRSGIKSIQAGTITLQTGTSSTATISTVDTAKAFVIFNGFSTGVTDLRQVCMRVSLTDATTVTATRQVTTSSNSNNILAYTVVEFY